MKRKQLEQLFANVSLTNQDRLDIIEQEFNKIRKVQTIKIIIFIILGVTLTWILTVSGIEIFKTVHNNKIYKVNDSLVIKNECLKWWCRTYAEKDNELSMAFNLAYENKDFIDLVVKLGFKEASNVVDTSAGNCHGLFSMDSTTLYGLGIRCKMKEFRNNYYLQLGALYLLFERNHEDYKYLDKYIGAKIKGIKHPIDKSSLAGMLFFSPTFTQVLLRSNGDTALMDGNKASILDYANNYYGYDINLY